MERDRFCPTFGSDPRETHPRVKTDAAVERILLRIQWHFEAGPTSVLESEMIGEVLEAVARRAREGMAVMVLTHERGCARGSGAA